MTVPTSARVRPPSRPDRDLRRSWIALALVPVAFVVATLVGEGLLSAQGYDSAASALPAGAVLLAGVPALLILITPGAAAGFYGRRAYRAGRTAAAVPAWIGVAVAVLAVAVNLAALIVSR